MTRDTTAKVAWLRNSTEHSLGNWAVGTVCVLCVCVVCVCVCVLYVLCVLSVVGSAAGLNRSHPIGYCSQPALKSPQHHSVKLPHSSLFWVPWLQRSCARRHTGLTIQALADIPHTSQETERSRSERSPGAGTRHKVDYILIAFVSPLSVWLQRTASIRCRASGKSLYRAVPAWMAVSAGTDLPAEWTDKQTTLQLHCTQRDSFLMFVNEPNNNFTLISTVVPCSLILSKFFICQLMHNRVALKEY